MTKRFLVVYECSGRSFGGFCPDVLGCVSTGRTLSKMRAMMREALEYHLESMAEHGELLPVPKSRFYIPDDEEVMDELDKPGYYYIVEKLDVKMPRKKRKAPSSVGSKRKSG